MLKDQRATVTVPSLASLPLRTRAFLRCAAEVVGDELARAITACFAVAAQAARHSPLTKPACYTDSPNWPAKSLRFAQLHSHLPEYTVSMERQITEPHRRGLPPALF
jgi:hypothetical protein